MTGTAGLDLVAKLVTFSMQRAENEEAVLGFAHKRRGQGFERAGTGFAFDGETRMSISLGSKPRIGGAGAIAFEMRLAIGGVELFAPTSTLRFPCVMKRGEFVAMGLAFGFPVVPKPLQFGPKRLLLEVRAIAFRSMDRVGPGPRFLELTSKRRRPRVRPEGFGLDRKSVTVA